VRWLTVTDQNLHDEKWSSLLTDCKEKASMVKKTKLNWQIEKLNILLMLQSSVAVANNVKVF
jgi:hypothetical protein